MDCILATGNAHKAGEFKELCPAEIISISAASEKLDVVEDGTSFMENSFKKAKSYYDRYQKPVLSDDSGLCVAHLPEELGIESARFGGTRLSDEERARLLISKCSEFSDQQRSAYFICVLCLYLSEDEVFFFEGRLEGAISKDYRGNQGFGYDPIFIPSNGNENETLAMQPEFKKKHSHRSKAVGSLLSFLRERDCQ
jgi:XTP/dITP diphosphohydrolase